MQKSLQMQRSKPFPSVPTLSGTDKQESLVGVFAAGDARASHRKEISKVLGALPSTDLVTHQRLIIISSEDPRGEGSGAVSLICTNGCTKIGGDTN
jgi:hypothetical protein